MLKPCCDDRTGGFRRCLSVLPPTPSVSRMSVEIAVDRIVTIAERRARALTARRDAIAAVMEKLGAYAKAKGGKFHVFGSVAKQQIREISDLDLIIDFPPDLERQAWARAERICSSHGVPHDIHATSMSSGAFLTRARATSLTLG